MDVIVIVIVIWDELDVWCSLDELLKIHSFNDLDQVKWCDMFHSVQKSPLLDLFIH